jgi:putative endopeptidase
LFVEKHFPESSKKHVEKIVVNLKAALHDRLAAMDWISETTRQAAFTKLDRITWKIGYPDKWIDYSKLEIKRDFYLQNVWRANYFEAQRFLKKINQPVDRSEWWISPQTVNAYYSASNNEIVFPAAILQPPFFDANVDDAINYGGIGAVIGHELTHGFDDEGRKYDAEGNLRDWWTEEDGHKFEARADGIRRQYSNYVAVDTFRINGELTSGENIADVGGLRIAYHAYQKSFAGKAQPPALDGFTAEQRFFIGFAHIWRGKIRDQAQIMYLSSDPHSPEQYRVLGTLANLPEFAQAFGCKLDAAMMLPSTQQLKIW